MYKKLDNSLKKSVFFLLSVVDLFVIAFILLFLQSSFYLDLS
jgi:hypothetical protein